MDEGDPKPVGEPALPDVLKSSDELYLLSALVGAVLLARRDRPIAWRAGNIIARATAGLLRSCFTSVYRGPAVLSVILSVLVFDPFPF